MIRYINIVTKFPIEIIKKNIKIENLSEDEKMIGLYDAEKIAEKVRNTQINNAKKEGIEQGAKKEKLEIANNMLQENVDINFISKVTNLSIKDIENLK